MHSKVDPSKLLDQLELDIKVIHDYHNQLIIRFNSDEADKIVFNKFFVDVIKGTKTVAFIGNGEQLHLMEKSPLLPLFRKLINALDIDHMNFNFNHIPGFEVGLFDAEIKT